MDENIRLLAEHTDDIIIVADWDANRLYISPSYYRLTGWTPDEVLSTHWHTRLHPDEVPAVNRAFMAVRQGESVMLEHRIRCKDASWIWVELRCKALRDAAGELHRLLLWSRDITARKEMEVALMQSQARLDRAQSIAKLGSFEIDLTTRVRRWSAEMFRIWRRDPALGYMVAEELLELIHPEDRDGVAQRVKSLQATGQPIECHFRIAFPDGEMRDIQGRGEVSDLDATGRPAKLVFTTQDVTEQKLVQTALEESEALLTLAQSIAHVGGFEIDLVTGVRKWSAEMYRIWERDPALGPVIEKDLESCIHPEDLARFSASRRLSLERGASYAEEFRIVLPGGRVKHLLVRGDTKRNPVGKPQRFVGIGQDITEQKRAQAALVESEARLSQAQSVAKIGSYDFDLRSGKRNWSAEMYRLWRRDPKLGPLPPAEVTAMVHPDDRDRFAKAMKATMEHGLRFDEQFRISLPGGRIRHIRSQGKVSRDFKGRPLQIFGIAQDITEQKLAQEILGKSERRLATIFNSVSDCLHLISVGSRGEFRFESVNEAFLQVTGFKREQIIGKRMEEWFPREALAQVRAKYREAITTKRPVEWVETTKLPAGVRVERVAVVPVFDEAGRCTQLIGTAHDITERHQLEEALLGATEEEQQRIGRDLHDGVGQGMTAISLLNNVLLEDLKKSRHPVVSTAKRLARLINDASQEIRRVARGLQPVAADPGGLMAGLQRLAEESASGKGPQCVFHCPDPVMVHNPEAANHLYRIAQEAVQNALRHGKPGRVVVRLLQSGGEVKLEVSDDGCGVPKRGAVSDGIGIRTMKYRAESLRGTLEISRRSPRGTLVRCRVPVPELPASPVKSRRKKSTRR